MQTMVDFCGFRLLAMPLLPVSQATLVYGVDSRTGLPVAPDPWVAGAMEAVGAQLHLAPHLVRGTVVALAGGRGRLCEHFARPIVCVGG